ncbi:flavin reductase family protein [Sporosarcina sp. P12(2017)]|uniref:flavin reductase family protein n=1 Tax=Sporosarcina sp. P12(2017) TaxID=2048561 RepID=UPI001E416F1E|nr:flavin reductase family protein [Sporosarcina sp. P12(2017)]
MINHKATSLEAFTNDDEFIVHVLADEQQELCKHLQPRLKIVSQIENGNFLKMGCQ